MKKVKSFQVNSSKTLKVPDWSMLYSRSRKCSACIDKEVGDVLDNLTAAIIVINGYERYKKW